MRRRSRYVAVAVIYAVAVYVALALSGTRAESIEILALVVACSVAAGDKRVHAAALKLLNGA